MGSRLCAVLADAGHRVTVLTRDARKGRPFRGRVTLSTTSPRSVAARLSTPSSTSPASRWPPAAGRRSAAPPSSTAASRRRARWCASSRAAAASPRYW
ncbi:MAG TPA: hypothetical protein VF502_08170 [Stellaceae bacterium]